jgi:long-chain acyl-CoA synthetase
LSSQINETVSPEAVAVVMSESAAQVTFGELESRSRRLAHLLRSRGLEAGSNLAVLLDNSAHYFDVCWATRRAGLYCTPINWHLGADEAGYIIEDCEATALITTARMKTLLADLQPRLGPVPTRLVVDGPLEGFEDMDLAIERYPDQPLPAETEGALMFYSSGTTGRPKGIKRDLDATPFGTPGSFDLLVQSLYGFEPGIVYLCPAPLYHAAPLGWSMAAQRAGGTVVVMERFDAEATLAAIEKYRVTHAQFVPTHFIRMLKLGDDVRARYDLSSLRMAVHAAAPCPVEVKQAMIDWWGPIVYEYYSGSEGVGFCAVGPDEWLARPGTVGKSLRSAVHVTGEHGEDLPSGQVGQIWFEDSPPFEYHHDPEKTSAAFNDRGWSTLGDVGFVDADGYLYLTDRVSHMIISGGVNIYPQETEDALVLHPAVADVAVIGIPDPEMGESVLAVVQPADPNLDLESLAEELDQFCRDRLAGYKCPRGYRFVDELPRLPTGKLLKRKLREAFGGATAATVVGAADSARIRDDRVG